MERDVVDRQLRAPGRRDRERGQRQHVEVARERALEAVLELARARPWPGSRSSPKLTAKTGTPRPGEAAQRGQDRAVAAQHHAQIGAAVVRVGAEHDAVARLDAVLLDLLGRQAHLHPGLRAAGDQRTRTARRSSPRAAVGEDRDGRAAVHGSTSRAAASTSASARPRPGSAIQTNVSRLPAGPGRPDEREARGRDTPSSRGRSPTADQRRAAVVGGAHHPALAHALAADLELRLDQRQAVEALGARSRAPRAAPWRAR